MGSGGGLVKNNRIETVGGGTSYKQYYMKQKRGVAHTKRPSAALQMEVSRNRTMQSLNYGSPRGLTRSGR